MSQVLIGVSEATIAASTTVYFGLNSFNTTNPTTDAAAYQVIPTGGTLSLLKLRPSGSPVQNATATLYLNGSSTALTCTTNSATIANDITHSITVAAGDKVSLQIAVAASATTRNYSWSMLFIPTVTGENILLGNTVATNTAANNFISLGMNSGPSATENAVSCLIPESGTVKKLYVVADTDPTAGGSSITFTTSVNSSPGNITGTISAGGTTCNDTTHTDTTTAGDLFSIKITTGGSPTFSPVHWGIVYVTPTSGNFIMFFTTPSAAMSTGSRNVPCHGIRGVTTGTAMAAVTLAFTYAKLYAWLSVAPGVGNTWGLRLFAGGSSVGSTLNITGAATTGNNSQSTTIAADSLINFNEIATGGTPTTGSFWKQALVGNYADPVSANTGRFFEMFY